MSLKFPLASSTIRASKTSSIYIIRDSKKRKNNRLTAEALKWRAIETSGAMLDEGGGMMLLEEVDGVAVEWEEDEEGRRRAVLVVRVCTLSESSWTSRAD